MSVATAVLKEQFEEVTKILSGLTEDEQKAKINEPNQFGDTALHVAAMKGNLFFVRTLVSRGANVSAVNQVNLNSRRTHTSRQEVHLYTKLP